MYKSHGFTKQDSERDTYPMEQYGVESDCRIGYPVFLLNYLITSKPGHHEFTRLRANWVGEKK